MENAQQQQEQWIVVKSKKSRRIEKEIKAEKVHVKGGNAKYSRLVNISLEEEFMADPRTHKNITIISEMLKSLKNKHVELNCLGIGNFSSLLKPQLQLLFLKHCLINTFQTNGFSLSINIYDPIFSQDEKQEVLALNSTCCQLKALKQQSSNLLYMPHCDRFLYQAVCQYKSASANCQVIVIGNSINDYKERCKLINQPIPTSLLPFSPAETRISDYRQAFNDTFIYTL